MLGFDILIDEKLKCWLIEVNAAPSMNLDSSLDKRVKLAVLERAIGTLGLIPKEALFGARVDLPGSLGGVGSEEEEEEESAVEEIEAKNAQGCSGATTARYGASSSSVVARPIQYRTVDYGIHNQKVTLEEKEMQHTVIVRRQRKYTARDLETSTMRPDLTWRQMFPFGGRTVQRMYLTFTTKRYSSGLSLGAFNRLVMHYGLKAGSATASSSASGSPTLTSTGEADLIYMRILRRSGERVMGFQSFCLALLSLASLRFPHVARQIEAYGMMIQEVERRHQAAVERAAARELRQQQLLNDATRLRDDEDAPSPIESAASKPGRPLSASGVLRPNRTLAMNVTPIDPKMFLERASPAAASSSSSMTARPQTKGAMGSGSLYGGGTSRLSSTLSASFEHRRVTAGGTSSINRRL